MLFGIIRPVFGHRDLLHNGTENIVMQNLVNLKACLSQNNILQYVARSAFREANASATSEASYKRYS